MSDAGRTRAVILLAEDEAIIAMELADSLEQDGFDVAGPFTSCAAAEAWLKINEPSGAILDNALKDGLCEVLAGDLRARGIPFVVYSGHSRTADLPEVFHDAPWVVKPVPIDTLLGALRSAMA